MLKIKKPRKKRLNLEEKEQMALIEWAHLHDDIWPYLIHIRNEGKRSLAEGAKAKRMGLMKGVSDLFFAQAVAIVKKNTDGKITDINMYHGFCIELKSKKGKLSEEQKEFLERMNGQYYQTGVYYSWTDAAKAICEYLGKDSHGI